MKINNNGGLRSPQSKNPTSKMWGHLISNVIVVFKLFEYVKLVEIAIVMFISTVEDELTYCTMTFLKF